MIFSALINNITLIIALSILYRFIIRRWEYGSRTGQAISGLLFGAVAVIGMINPLIISPGLIFDGRSIIISIAGFMGGWVTALIAALMGMIYRIWLGGPGGIMGVSVIASSAVIGIAYHYIRRRSPHAVGPLHLIGFGIIVHICMLAMTMTLPSGMRFEVLSKIAVPVILIYPLGTLLVCVVLLDLESRIRADAALRESEVRYRELVENAGEAIFVAQEGSMVFHNPKTAEVIGYSGEELMSRPFVEFIHPDDRDMVIDRHVKRTKGEKLPHVYSFRIVLGNGNPRWVELNTVVVNWKGKPATLNFLCDITERKEAEEAISVAKNDWENTFDTVTEIITVHDENFNIVRANPAARAILGLQPQEGMPLAKCFKFYHGTESPPAECPSCQCIRTGKPCTVEVFEPYLNKHIEISATPRFGSDGRPVGLIHVARDITERKKAEGELRQTLDRLRKAVGATVQVMASAVEARDPYTAGHQIRSADLARVIATEMGLPQDKIEGIRIAGSIHDIGKLSIPAEILSKPTKLSELEFSLIKEHAGRGFEMLKDVESPWPLAEIVYQHHERMDGSGYPRNLKGDDILIEARILTVADVVEAMASHRPYRPGLGIDAALNEIEKNSGIFYDNAVASACLRLFREKGFKLEKTWQ